MLASAVIVGKVLEASSHPVPQGMVRFPEWRTMILSMSVSLSSFRSYKLLQSHSTTPTHSQSQSIQVSNHPLGATEFENGRNNGQNEAERRWCRVHRCPFSHALVIKIQNTIIGDKQGSISVGRSKYLSNNRLHSSKEAMSCST